MFIAGTRTITMQHFIKVREHTMSTMTFWEPDTAIADATAMQDFANAAQAAVSGILASVMSDEVTLPTTHVVYSDGSSVQLDAYSAVAAVVVGSAHNVIAGDPGEETLPNIDALVIQRKTGLRGRQHSGRIFIPGIWEGLSDNGQLNADGQTAGELIAEYLGADKTFNGILCHCRHWNRKDNAFEVVTDCRVRQEVARRGDRANKGYILAY